jgi:proline dehydrogenase
MSLMRKVFLEASQNQWLRERASRYRFVKRSVSRFMPGETVEDALPVAAELAKAHLGTVFTKLGENVAEAAEAEQVVQHYCDVLVKLKAAGLPTELSVKPTQLGLDLGADLCYANLKKIIAREDPARVVWMDMEASQYVDATLALYRRAKAEFANVGVCLQAYLYRTAKDLEALLPLGPAIRLVKGAYQEPASIAYPAKKDVDANYFALAKMLVSEAARRAGVRAAFATHDGDLIRLICDSCAVQGLPKSAYEFQMLYGIQRAEQLRLAQEGWRMMVLVSYGSYWFPWYMRRLAERPANAWFVVRNLLSP